MSDCHFIAPTVSPASRPGFDEDLLTLQRLDDSVTSIIGRCNYVTACYEVGQESRSSFEGRMIVYARASRPLYGFCILKDEDVVIHNQQMNPEDHIIRHRNGLSIKFYRSRPSPTPVNLPSKIIYRLLNIHRIVDLDSAHKGVTNIITLGSLAEEMIEFIIRLYSYVMHNGFHSTADTLESHQVQVTPNRLFASTPTLSSHGFSAPPIPESRFHLSFPPTFYSPFSPSTLNAASSPTLASTSIFEAHPRAVIHADSARKIMESHRSLQSLDHTQDNSDHQTGDQVRTERSRTFTTCPKGNVHRWVSMLGLETFMSGGARSILCAAPNSLNQLSFDTEPHRKTSQLHQHGNAINNNSDLHCPERHLQLSISRRPRRDLGVQYYKTDELPFARGGFSDVYRGISSLPDRHYVAIKDLRIPGYRRTDKEGMARELRRRVSKEAKIWGALDHPNVLPFLGVSYDFSRFPALISPYCPFHDMIIYLKGRPDVPRWPILLGLTEGLKYLHSKEVVHGDLKGSNVLIDPNGEALLCDFGISQIIHDQCFTTGFVASSQFMAPELFLDEDMIEIGVEFRPVFTKETDIYAYGLVLLQAITNKDPKPHYHGIPKRLRYEPISDRLWALAEMCCHFDPNKRPSVSEVMDHIRPIAGLPISLPVVDKSDAAIPDL